jgi:hypothetical protein
MRVRVRVRVRLFCAWIAIAVCGVGGWHRGVTAAWHLPHKLPRLPGPHEQGEKTGSFGHLYIKTIFLPRQARDKHRENQKRDRFLAGPNEACLVEPSRAAAGAWYRGSEDVYDD